ncbi:hypothetical protein PybrP1_010397 [[Pythium] brassicae (nom. inval.)]|nr:hypothetical protein PybrP1_010397 [[Pythium] brassicae (nom. inval.)]
MRSSPSQQLFCRLDAPPSRCLRRPTAAAQATLSRKQHSVRVPRCDVGASAKFAWYRCLFSILGTLLVLSDVPRSGYGSHNLSVGLKQLMPGAFVTFGPYGYSVARIVRGGSDTPSAFNGTRGANEIVTTQVWAHKFDSLSVVLRSIARDLKVREHPQCLLYLEQCPMDMLSLRVTFTMLDAVVGALYGNYFRLHTKARGEPSGDVNGIPPRLDDMETRYPHLEFDLVVITSLQASSNAQHTRLVDDYRYERSILYMDVEDWYGVVRILCGAAQLYCTITSIFKIPSHVIVYGSWVPIVLYVSAYFVDSGIVHFLCERVWSSVNCAVQFNLLAYVTTASVQMRNAWLLVVGVKIVVVFQVYCLPPRRSPGWSSTDSPGCAEV